MLSPCTYTDHFIAKELQAALLRQIVGLSPTWHMNAFQKNPNYVNNYEISTYCNSIAAHRYWMQQEVAGLINKQEGLRTVAILAPKKQGSHFGAKID